VSQLIVYKNKVKMCYSSWGQYVTTPKKYVIHKSYNIRGITKLKIFGQVAPISTGICKIYLEEEC
jgi:hypothetical protein